MNIAVIGAGIAGLTCAYELQKKGHTVTVYEKESYVGGRMSTRTIGEFPMDIGANHLANVYTHMRQYADELDLKFEPMAFLNYKIFKSGELLPLLDGIGKKSRFRLAVQAFLGVRKPTDFFDLSTAAAFDTDDAASFAKKKLTQEAHDYLIDPFVSTYQFHRANEISLGLVYAMMRTHYRETADWALHQIRGGMIALPQALANRLNMRLETPVSSITHTEDGVVVDVDGTSENYDTVVVATTATVANNICKNLTDGQRSVLNWTTYAPTLGMGFVVPRELLGDITIVWVPFVESHAISGYTNEAMKGDPLIRDGKTLLLTWYHEEFAKSIIHKSDDEIFAITKQELAKVCPLINDPSILEPYDLQRWEEAMPKFTHGHLARVKTFEEEHQGENNIFFAGDYLNAPWTEGALRNGQEVAEQIHKNA